jgi:hypothetical protein
VKGVDILGFQEIRMRSRESVLNARVLIGTDLRRSFKREDVEEIGMEASTTTAEEKVWETIFWKAKRVLEVAYPELERNSPAYHQAVVSIALKIIDLDSKGNYEKYIQDTWLEIEDSES